MNCLLFAPNVPPSFPSTYHSITRDEIHRKTFFIKDCPLWSESLSSAATMNKHYEILVPWVVDADVRKCAAQAQLYISGVRIGRTAQNPSWQPEICTPRY